MPQGSILDQLLFFLYINDLPLNVQHAMVPLYANDTALKIGEDNPLNTYFKFVTDFKMFPTGFAIIGCLKMSRSRKL